MDMDVKLTARQRAVYEFIRGKSVHVVMAPPFAKSAKTSRSAPPMG